MNDENLIILERSIKRFDDNSSEGVWEVVLVSNEIDRYNTRTDC